MEIEIRVTNDEFQKIRKEKKEIERRFYELGKLEKTLQILEINYLLEKRRRLEEKLKEMEEHYQMLLKFSEKAKKDKEKMKEFRLKLSIENRELRREMKENENRGKA
ncbi:hypothetical protein VFC49_00440 [Thermococcus sp. SY098]|uniref:hypothetical protein n=1 Tax=Thermococcus sp. SY098 TaxID=3111325 RepID=UPI002D799174|nr:hypothetical protein [Thermococcus sp. SY098]WRS52678.1 hypothetical protein VFC49_00440 [Thermococcus sp. SY098]